MGPLDGAIPFGVATLLGCELIGASYRQGCVAELATDRSPTVGAEGLRPGALLPVSLERPVREQTVAIPFSALYGADSVYLMTDDQRLKRIKVNRIGEAQSHNGERRLLISAEQLTPGTQLITTHLPNAVTGLKVEVADAAGGVSR